MDELDQQYFNVVTKDDESILDEKDNVPYTWGSSLERNIKYTEKERQAMRDMVRYWELVQPDGSVIKLRRKYGEMLPSTTVNENRKDYQRGIKIHSRINKVSTTMPLV